ncbi:MAG: hypothetical protein QXS48_03085 [Candidatus Aenigmatarchaeota archaeon]
MRITKRQINQIENFAKNFYKKLDETHGIEHLRRTIKLATYIGKREGTNIKIVKLGAMLHQFHNGKVVEKFLKNIRIDKNLIKEIVHCVDCSSTKNIHKAKSIEAKVVYDADKLQVIGPFGIVREVACNIGARKMKFREALKYARKIEQKCFETLQTKTAKKLAKYPHSFIVKFWKIFDKWDKIKI